MAPPSVRAINSVFRDKTLVVIARRRSKIIVRRVERRGRLWTIGFGPSPRTLYHERGRKSSKHASTEFADRIFHPNDFNEAVARRARKRTQTQELVYASRRTRRLFKSYARAISLPMNIKPRLLIRHELPTGEVANFNNTSWPAAALSRPTLPGNDRATIFCPGSTSFPKACSFEFALENPVVSEREEAYSKRQANETQKRLTNRERFPSFPTAMYPQFPSRGLSSPFFLEGKKRDNSTARQILSL